MNKRVGKLIKKKRQRLKLTQEDLAKKLRVSSSTISNWETGSNYPEKEVIPKICEVLKMNEKDFKEKYKTYEIKELSKKSEKIISILRFTVLFIGVYILLSTVLTIYSNTLSYSSRQLASVKYNAYSSFFGVDKKAKEEADKNLEKIKAANNSNYDEETKKRLVEGLEEMAKTHDKIMKLDIRVKNNYDATVLGLKIRDLMAKNGDIKALSAIMSIDKRDKEEKQKEYAHQMFNKKMGLEYAIREEGGLVIFPQYEFPSMLDTLKVIAKGSYAKIYNFSYDKYYLAITEYAMKVGGINE